MSGFCPALPEPPSEICPGSVLPIRRNKDGQTKAPPKAARALGIRANMPLKLAKCCWMRTEVTVRDLAQFNQKRHNLSGYEGDEMARVALRTGKSNASRDPVEASSRTYNRCRTLLAEACEIEPQSGQGPRLDFEMTVLEVRRKLEGEAKGTLTEDDFAHRIHLRGDSLRRKLHPKPIEA